MTNEPAVLIPDRWGGVSVCDLGQLLARLEEGQSLEDAIANSSFDSSQSNPASVMSTVATSPRAQHYGRLRRLLGHRLMVDKRRSRPVPEWATELIDRICCDHGRRAPTVTWWQRDDWESSGRTFKGEGRIHITAGTSLIDARLVLVHELAHWLGRPTWHHNRRFWELAWPLYARHGVDLDWAMFREATYVTKSMNYCPFVETA